MRQFPQNYLQVVLLDEPTFSLDPASRQDIWDLLLEEKTGRCILISTIYIEATEKVADRVAIISDGKMVGYGSANYLIDNLGPGYKLVTNSLLCSRTFTSDLIELQVCVLKDNCDVENLTMYLTRHIDNIEAESIEGNNMIFRIKAEYDNKFKNIICDLEKNQANLQLISFAVCAPTMTETILMLGSAKWKRESSDGMYQRISVIIKKKQTKIYK